MLWFGLSRFGFGLDLDLGFCGVCDGAVQNRQKETADKRWRAVWLSLVLKSLSGFFGFGAQLCGKLPTAGSG